MSECRKHHFNSSGRCSVCQIQARYYYEAMTTLGNWSNKEKKDPNERWQEKMDSYQCKPHTHYDNNTIVIMGEKNPLEKLYQMEKE